MYRYGDGTPCPCDDNLIELITAAVEASAQMCAAAAQLDAQRARAQGVRKDADGEVAALAALEASIEAVVAPARPSSGKDATPVQEAAQRALDGGRAAVLAARAALERRVALAAAEPRIDRAMAASAAAAGALLARHALPGTAWRWSWTASGGGDATATSERFVASFELTEPPWPGPARLAALLPGLALRLPRPRLLGKPAPARVVVERAAVTAASRDGAAVVLTVRAHAGKPSIGWRLTVPDGAGAVAWALLDPAGAATRHAGELDGDDAAAARRLADAVATAMTGALARRRAREVQLDGAPLRAATDPAAPARALLELLGPTIRAIAERSRVPGELSLKRDLGAGRREELFVARAALAERFAGLPPIYRALFEAAGLREPAAAPAAAAEATRIQTDRDDDELTTDRRNGPRVPPPPPRAAPAARTLVAV